MQKTKQQEMVLVPESLIRALVFSLNNAIQFLQSSLGVAKNLDKLREEAIGPDNALVAPSASKINKIGG